MEKSTPASSADEIINYLNQPEVEYATANEIIEATTLASSTVRRRLIELKHAAAVEHKVNRRGVCDLWRLPKKSFVGALQEAVELRDSDDDEDPMDGPRFESIDEMLNEYTRLRAEVARIHKEIDKIRASIKLA